MLATLLRHSIEWPECTILHPWGSQTMGKQKLFYGWVVAAASAVGIAGSVSVFIPATMSLLIRPIGGEFGWSPPAMFLGITFAAVATIVVAPFIGGLVDRFGARRMILASFLFEAALIYSFHYLTPDIRWFYLRYALLAALASGTTALTFSALIARWFDGRRGLALGIGLSGLGFGGAFWSLITQWLISEVGWRATFPYLAAVIAFIVLPILLLCVRETPGSMGLEVDNAAPDPAGKPAAVVSLAGLSLSRAAASGTYWKILVCFFGISTTVYGVTLSIVPLMQQQGFTASTGAAVQASTWVALVFGRLASGWLIDRYFAPRVAAAFMVPAIVGLVLLASGSGTGLAYVGAALVGLASGAEVDVLAYLTSRYFGLRHFGKIYATFFSAYALGTSVGPIFISWAAERTSGYELPLWALAVIMAIAAATLTRFKPFPKLSEKGAA